MNTTRTVLLESPEVSVACKQLRIDGSSYALAEIESIEIERVPTAATGPILMIAVGAICLFSAFGEAGLSRALLGGGLLLGAAGWWIRKKPTFKVVVRTSAGEWAPFESRDESASARVLAAVREARGHPA